MVDDASSWQHDQHEVFLKTFIIGVGSLWFFDLHGWFIGCISQCEPIASKAFQTIWSETRVPSQVRPALPAALKQDFSSVFS